MAFWDGIIFIDIAFGASETSDPMLIHDETINELWIDRKTQIPV
jgi:hypothetical protein